MPAFTLFRLWLAALCLGAGLQAQNFVIEAEDFDYDGGQHPPLTDQMPYYGGAFFEQPFDGLPAIAGVDYAFALFQPFGDLYRNYEDPNVPLRDVTWNPATLNRGSWDMQWNFMVGWLNPNNTAWFNYTREMPVGRYRVYAALSWGDLTPGALKGRLGVVVAGAGTVDQSVLDLGEFQGDGSGGWDSVRRVPLRQNGQRVVLDLGGSTTFRYSALSGDFDYLFFVPEESPEATVTPTVSKVAFGEPVSLTAEVAGTGPFTYQWKRNGQEVPGADRPQLTIPAVGTDTAGRYSLRVENAFGAWESDPVDVSFYFPLALGDLVAPDQPYPGAGRLDPANTQIQTYEYRFEAPAGQLLYLESLTQTSCGETTYFLDGPPESGFFAWGELGQWCGGSGGSHVLPVSGTYTIRIIANPNYSDVREYSFRLGPPTVVSQPVQVGDSVYDFMEMPGLVKEYALDVNETQDVYFRRLAGAYSQQTWLRWTLLDPDGVFLFQEILYVFEGPISMPIHRLSKTGTYRLLVTQGDGFNQDYGFELVRTTIQHHFLPLGQTVLPDQPDAGSGQTSQPGELDIYHVTIPAGATVKFHEIVNPNLCLGVVWQLWDANGKVLFRDYLDDQCSGGGVFNPDLQTFATGGTYSIYVWVPYGGTGPHSFELLPTVPVQTFDLELGAVVRKDKPAPGAGYLDANGTYDDYEISIPEFGVYVLEDLGSTGSRLMARLVGSAPFSGYPILEDRLDGGSPTVVALDRGVYRLRILATAPQESGSYSFRLRVTRPPVAGADTVQVPRGRAVNIPKTRLLGNDSDPDGDKVQFWFVYSYSDNSGTVEDLGNSIRYTPPAGFTGTDRVSYFILDATGMSAIGDVRFVVR